MAIIETRRKLQSWYTEKSKQTVVSVMGIY